MWSAISSMVLRNNDAQIAQYYRQHQEFYFYDSPWDETTREMIVEIP